MGIGEVEAQGALEQKGQQQKVEFLICCEGRVSRQQQKKKKGGGERCYERSKAIGIESHFWRSVIAHC
jgi:hypothetical protein